jgi:hypothetical protein
MITEQKNTEPGSPVLYKDDDDSLSPGIVVGHTQVNVKGKVERVTISIGTGFKTIEIGELIQPTDEQLEKFAKQFKDLREKYHEMTKKKA